MGTTTTLMTTPFHAVPVPTQLASAVITDQATITTLTMDTGLEPTVQVTLK